MKNSKLIKLFLVGMISLCLVLTATSVFADDDDGFVDLTNTVESNTATSENTSTTDNTTLDQNVAVDVDVNTNTNTSLTTNETNVNTNSSSYNTNVNANTNSNLPSTGIAGSGTIVAIFVVLAVSGVYAFKKLRDYKNI